MTLFHLLLGCLLCSKLGVAFSCFGSLSRLCVLQVVDGFCCHSGEAIMQQQLPLHKVLANAERCKVITNLYLLCLHLNSLLLCHGL